MLSIFLYGFIGIGSGFLAGLLGVGGGVIVVPSLVYTFQFLHMPSHAVMHMATSSSLTSMILTTLMAVIVQQLRKNIDWRVLRQFSPGLLIGIILGAYIAGLLSTHWLKLIFGIFLLIISLHMVWQKESIKITNKSVTASSFTTLGLGMLVGIMSGLLGIGGGTLAVPIFLRLGLPVHKATATSSACAFLLSIVGTMSFIIMGSHTQNLPAGSTGYVFWPAVICIAIASIIFVPLGVKAAQRLGNVYLKKVFAGFLFIVGLTLLA